MRPACLFFFCLLCHKSERLNLIGGESWSPHVGWEMKGVIGRCYCRVREGRRGMSGPIVSSVGRWLELAFAGVFKKTVEHGGSTSSAKKRQGGGSVGRVSTGDEGPYVGWERCWQRPQLLLLSASCWVARAVLPATGVAGGRSWGHR